MILEPTAALAGALENTKTITVLYISYDSGARRPVPPTSKTMKILTVLYISHESEATRPLPAHFQNHENADSLNVFLMNL